MAKIRAPCALQASLQIFGRRMRTYILCRVRHRIGRIGLLPQPTQKPPDWVAFVLAGVAGFGPTNARVKVWCLTAWLYPKNMDIEFQHSNYTTTGRTCQEFSGFP